MTTFAKTILPAALITAMFGAPHAPAIAEPQDLLVLTAADEKAVRLASLSVRMAENALRLGVVYGTIQPDRDVSLRTRNLLIEARIAILAAESARDAQKFHAALDNANTAVADILAAIGGHER